MMFIIKINIFMSTQPHLQPHQKHCTETAFSKKWCYILFCFPNFFPFIQEFIALGLINIVGCFFSSFTAAGSLSRSSVQAAAGGKTQLVGLFSSAIMMVVLLKIGSLFEPLPKVSRWIKNILI